MKFKKKKRFFSIFIDIHRFTKTWLTKKRKKMS